MLAMRFGIDWRKLVAAILLCELAGLVGSVFTFSALQSWYGFLQKPWFTPPGWIFAPVWTLLYLLMGVSLYLVWIKGLDQKPVQTAVRFFLLQLSLNVLWSILFFGFRSPFWALIEIVLLWLSIGAAFFSFRPVSKKAAWLLVPYWLWTSFAAVLNLFVWLLNP